MCGNFGLLLLDLAVFNLTPLLGYPNNDGLLMMRRLSVCACACGGFCRDARYAWVLLRMPAVQRKGGRLISVQPHTATRTPLTTT